MTDRTTQWLAAAAALVILVTAAVIAPWHVEISDGPNVVLILSDDQSLDSIPFEPPTMPFLQGRVTDPDDHWIDFSNAYISDPLCCPARASILAGQYAFNTGVRKNGSGKYFREDSTLVTWLDSVGYRTALFGKYINQYPFGRSPYMPPGWDVWASKYHGPASTVYFNYQLVEGEGEVVAYGGREDEYMPDVLADKAVTFIEESSPFEPFFLMYAPTAPHSPRVPPPRHEGDFVGVDLPKRPNVNEEDRSDKPQWVQELNKVSERKAEIFDYDQRNEYETLRGLDDDVQRIYKALADKGVLDDTIIIYLTDNGFSYGSHNWTAKRCPYEECIATPMYVRVPGKPARTVTTPVSNVDLAPTIAALAGVTPGLPEDGMDLGPLLSGGEDALPRPGVLLEWPGDPEIPAYWGLRTQDFLWVEYSTGEKELYDMTGVLGDADPWQMENRVGNRAYTKLELELAAQLREMLPTGATVPPPPFVP